MKNPSPPDFHRPAALRSIALGISLNRFVQKAVAKELEELKDE